MLGKTAAPVISGMADHCHMFVKILLHMKLQASQSFFHLKEGKSADYFKSPLLYVEQS